MMSVAPDQGLTLLKATSKKLTPQRREILKVLIDGHKPLAVQEVFDKVSSVLPSLSLDTVYRNLLMLTQQGLVSQINLQTKSKAKFEFIGSSRHFHAVCLDCGEIACVDNHPLQAGFSKPLTVKNFTITGYAFEVYGLCQKCEKFKKAQKV